MGNKVKRKIKNTGKYVTRAEREEKAATKKRKWIGIGLMIIMIFSVAGFALLTSSGHGGGNDGTYSDIPFQQFNDQQSGQIFWGAIVNGEQFVFLDITGFDEFSNLAALGNELKSRGALNIYVDSNFTSSDAVYGIEKALTAFEVPYSRSPTLDCNPNTLVLTNERNFEGDCLVFEAPLGEESRYSEALLYHMVQ